MHLFIHKVIDPSLCHDAASATQHADAPACHYLRLQPNRSCSPHMRETQLNHRQLLQAEDEKGQSNALVTQHLTSDDNQHEESQQLTPISNYLCLSWGVMQRGQLGKERARANSFCPQRSGTSKRGFQLQKHH